MSSQAIVFQSPSKYIQQRGALKHIGEYVRATFPKTKRACILTSQRLRTRYLQELKQSLVDPVDCDFGGECCMTHLQLLEKQLEGTGVDHVVAFGGGKLLDMAKLLAHKLDLKCIIVPSIAATDAPCIALSVLYTDEGNFVDYEFYHKPSDMVIVDSEVIANAPVKFLVAGMGDAMSTYYEARACLRNPKATSLIAPCKYRPPMIARAIAQECLQILYTHGAQAKADCEANTMSEALDPVIEANILMSGLGAESGGLAIAHGLHNAMTLLPATHSLMHGEKVAYGTIVQLLYERDIDEAIKVVRFNKTVGLPTTLADLHIDAEDGAQLDLLVANCMEEGTTCWNEAPDLSSQVLKEAILEADRLGRTNRVE